MEVKVFVAEMPKQIIEGVKTAQELANQISKAAGSTRKGYTGQTLCSHLRTMK